MAPSTAQMIRGGGASAAAGRRRDRPLLRTRAASACVDAQLAADRPAQVGDEPLAVRSGRVARLHPAGLDRDASPTEAPIRRVHGGRVGRDHVEPVQGEAAGHRGEQARPVAGGDHHPVRR